MFAQMPLVDHALSEELSWEIISLPLLIGDALEVETSDRVAKTTKERLRRILNNADSTFSNVRYRLIRSLAGREMKHGSLPPGILCMEALNRGSHLRFFGRFSRGTH